MQYTTYVKKTTTVAGHDIELEVGDFTGNESYHELRKGYYGIDVRVVLMCIDLSNYDTLENVEEQVSV